MPDEDYYDHVGEDQKTADGRIPWLLKTPAVIKGAGFPAYLAHLLRKYGLSQRELAKRSGLNYVTINRLIKGKQPPAASSIDKLTKGLGCSNGERYGMHLCADTSAGRLVRSISSVLHHWREFRDGAGFDDYIEKTFGAIVDE